MKKIFISTTSFSKQSSEPIELLEKNQIDYKINKTGRKLTAEETIEALKDCEAVIAGTEIYSDVVLSSLPNLKLISRMGVGIDNIDLDTIDKNNIKLFKTKTTPAIAVAELSLGLMINLLRKININNNNLKKTRWKKIMGSLLSRKTLGIVGLGTIGKELVKISKGFNLNYLAFDNYKDLKFAKEHNVNYTDLNKLLSESDIISIHLNLNNETDKIINGENINLIKSSAILINTSRGEVIDELALFKALKSKNIYGAGLDVFSDEPYAGNLCQLENVVLTPHIGSYAKEIRIQMEIESVENIIRGFNEI